MKNRRGKKLEREEWGQRAHALFDRPAEDAQPKTTRIRRKSNPPLDDRAREEWTSAGGEHTTTAAAPGIVTPDPAMSSALHEDGPALAEKPGRGEWIKWAHVVIDRLTTCAHVYGKPAPKDVIMPNEERQEKNGRALDLLRRIHALTDDADTPTDSLTELEHHDERTIAGLSVILGEVLMRLPELSSDMQRLLKSPWRESCNGRLADELFRGPGGHEPEGIGSGYPDDGRLPASLLELLEREGAGEGRHPREALRGPQAQMVRWHEEAHRRWAGHNNHLLRTAGRVE